MSAAVEEQESGAAVRPLDVSILIVTWNSARWIERCLRSLPAACAGLSYEVLVQDNASSDATLERIASAREQKDSVAAEIVRSDANEGFGAGINRTLARSRGRYVFLMNPDCAPEPGALRELIGFLDARPEVAGAAPLLVGPDGNVQREFQLRRLPTFTTLAAEVLLLDKLFPRNPATARHRYRELDLAAPERVEQPAAAAWLLRKEVFAEIGSFDERFEPAWFEDVDYCRRLAERNRQIWLVPAARVLHEGGASLEHLTFSGFTAIWYRNMWRYAQKWFTPGVVEALRWMIIAGMMMRLAAGLLGLRPSGVPRVEALKAYAGVLRKAFARWS